MKLNDLGCSGSPSTAGGRCDAELPDNPQCAPNYHFGMLLGVEDFRAEQGFHLGRQRRHQRLLHGAGVVAGYGVSFKPAEQELRVAPGHAVDARGRDLVLDTAQCVSLPLWWAKHRNDEAFADLAGRDDVQLDLELRLCWHACLGSPVPAMAEPCAGDASDIAYSRICETVQLSLVRVPAMPAEPAQPYHLLRMWLTMSLPRLDPDGLPEDADQWLIQQYQALMALPASQQPAARAALQREVLARAVAEEPPLAALSGHGDDHGNGDGGDDDGAATCLTLARLPALHLRRDGETGLWAVATPPAVDQGVREVLLPTALLQALLLAEPPPSPPAAGPEVARDGATLDGNTVVLAFTQPLAPASVAPAAFAVAEFIEASGWQPFTLGPPAYDSSNPLRPLVRLPLDRSPTGARLRITVAGNGPSPLLGAQLIPAGALSPDSDGRSLSTTIHGV